MPIEVYLQDERGKTLATLDSPSWLTQWMLRCGNLASTACLRFIDPYGNTVFNRAQIHELIGELNALETDLSDEMVERAYAAWLARCERASPGSRAAQVYPKPTRIAICDHINSLRQFAIEGGKTPHHYLRFVGD